MSGILDQLDPEIPLGEVQKIVTLFGYTLVLEPHDEDYQPEPEPEPLPVGFALPRTTYTPKHKE